MGISDMWSSITPKAPGAKGAGGGRRERDELEDGNYVVKVVSFDYWSHDDGKPNPERYKWGLEVVEGLCKGKYVEKYQRASEIGLQILADDMMLLLGKLPGGDEIFNRAKNTAGIVVSAVYGSTIRMRQVTSASGYPNYYFNEVVQDEFASGTDDDKKSELDEDDEIPF